MKIILEKERFVKNAVLIIICVMAMISAVKSEEIYRLETKIGDRVFYDILTIDDAYNISKGTLTVPGVFTAPLINTSTKFTWGVIFYDFDVIVRKSNEEYIVTYSLLNSYQGEFEMRGTLKKDGKQIGTIKGINIFRGLP